MKLILTGLTNQPQLKMFVNFNEIFEDLLKTTVTCNIPKDHFVLEYQK